MTTVPPQSLPSQAFPVHACPWDGTLTYNEGICGGCERRLQLTDVYSREGVAPLPVDNMVRVRYARNSSLNVFRVYALMCEHGVIANWIRPDHAAYAIDAGMTRQAVQRAIAHMVEWGWLDTRKVGLKLRNSPREYRLAIRASI